MKKITYAVIGSGALGGFYGSLLARAGEEVNFLFHGDYDFVSENGLTVDTHLDLGNFRLDKVNAYRNTADMPPADVILVCLKTVNNDLLKSLLPPIIKKDSIILLIQNGLGVEEDMANAFPDTAIAGGLAFTCVRKIEPGHIEHLDYGDINFAFHKNQFDYQKEYLLHTAESLKKSGIASNLVDNLKALRWRKLIWNITYNGMTVVLNTTTGAIMNNPSTRQLSKDLMLEVIHGAGACGINFPESLADDLLIYTDKMKPYAPSMKLDFDFKRPMEIHYIYSMPIQIAEKNGFKMEKTDMLEKQLRFIEAIQAHKN